jgi:hypothetical protein
MPPEREFRWVEEPVQVRAPRRDAAEWEKYREIIIREFKQDGVTHAMKYMKREHNFIAKYSSPIQKSRSLTKCMQETSLQLSGLHQVA